MISSNLIVGNENGQALESLISKTTSAVEVERIRGSGAEGPITSKTNPPVHIERFSG